MKRVLALTTFFLMIFFSISLAESATLTIFTESGATVKIDDEIAGIVKDGHITVKIQSGMHTISVSKPGYKTETVELDVHEETKVKIELKPLGELEIKSSPPSRVEINGEFYGITPILVKLPEGKYRVSIHCDGYVPVERTIEIEGFKTLVLDEKLVKLGSFKLKTIPPKARVEINGKFVGITPLSTSLEPGEYTIRITHPETFEKVLKVKMGDEPKELTLRLEYFGMLNIHGDPEGAKITLDGELSCLSPCELKKLKLGTHRLVVEKEGYEKQQVRIQILRGKNEYEYSLRRIMCDLSIESSPSVAMVSVDGKFSGFTPLATKLAYGYHRIYVKKDEYEWEWDGKIDGNKKFFVDFSEDSTLKLSSDQDGTFVLLSGKPVPLPTTLNLKKGVYSLTFVHKDYGKRLRHFILEAGRIHEYTVNMVGEAFLNVVTLPSLSDIQVMGEEKPIDLGNSPLIMEKINVNYETVKLIWKNRTKVLKIKPKDGTVLLVNEDLRGNVELHITTFPSGVSIYLNDSYVGDTPLNMEIPSGIYDMRLVKEGYKEEKLKIDLRFDDVRYFVWFMRRR